MLLMILLEFKRIIVLSLSLHHPVSLRFRLKMLSFFAYFFSTSLFVKFLFGNLDFSLKRLKSGHYLLPSSHNVQQRTSCPRATLRMPPCKSYSLSASTTIWNMCSITSTVSKRWPFTSYFVLRKRKKPQGVKSGEQGALTHCEQADTDTVTRTTVQVVCTECSPSHPSELCNATWCWQSNPWGWIHSAQPSECWRKVQAVSLSRT